jgi:UDP-N-acetyl-D-galactosamine dehydrogenase
VTSGSTREAADFIDSVYSQIITAGTFKADSIRIAEAAKVIENTQRDLNIALINELAIIFEKMNIDTLSVLEAAGTKWNFLPFRPGLVGGHCIGVDPYYLTYKAQSVGYHPEIILSGRRINDGMGNYIASKMVKEMLRKKIHVSGSNVLVMGFAFKENCPDHRNTKVIDIIEELASYDVNVDIYDPWVNMDTNSGYNILPFDDIKLAQYDGIIFAVAHQDFIERGAEAMRKFLREKAVVFDVKGIFPNENDYLRL